MAAYRRVYVSRHLQVDCQDQLQNPTLGNGVWAAFALFMSSAIQCQRHQLSAVAAADRPAWSVGSC